MIPLWKMRRPVVLAAAIACCIGGSHAIAGQGEMGTGIPQFGTYGAATGNYTAVWSLASPSIPMRATCTTLYLIAANWGADAYKIAIATLLTAKASGRKVRFYSHADTGCEVDYVEIQE